MKPSVILALLAVIGITQPVLAQSTAPLTPRLGVGYTTSGGGFDGVTSFEGYLPLVQAPGSNVLFLEGRLLLDNDANTGGNILLGYRTYDQATNSILGGYIGYDNRDTDKNSFSQLGFGIERLGEAWDMRANAYIPIGDTRQLVSERTFDQGSSLGSLGFQGNSLSVIGQRQRQILRSLEAAVGGFEVEVGRPIARLGSGDLRGYGGLYYYNAAGGIDTVGWRLRLEARPTDGLNLGLALQDDGLFGTNLIASLGLNFPGTRPRGVLPQSTLARLGESPTRAATVVVKPQVESKVISEPFAVVATNPATGQPYFFQHVNLGATGGNGTAEQPYGTVEPALSATRSHGNDIVYVEAGSNPGIPGMTIGDRIQVLSTSPAQFLNTTEFGVVQLPRSGTGVLPTITSTVTLGNQSTLSGFAINTATGAGVAASKVGNALVTDSTITTTNNAAVLLNNTTGTISFTRTNITGNNAPALVGTGITNLALTDSSLTSTNSTTDGITVDGVSGTTTIRNTPIQIANSKDDGIFLNNVTGKVDLPQGVITKPGASGVAVQNSPGNIAINNFQISNSEDSGIFADTVGNLTLQNNRIDTPKNQGIAVNNASTSVKIADNTIANTVRVVNNASTSVKIADNTIANTVRGTTTVDNPITLPGTGSTTTIPTPVGEINLPVPTGNIPLPTGQGIVVANAQGTVEVARNGITNTATQGVVILNAAAPVTVTDNSITNTVGTATGSTIPVSTGQGIVLGNITAPLEVSRNTVSNTNGQGIVLAGATQTVGINSNKVDRTTDQGILVAGTTASVTIANNTVTNTTGQTYAVPNPLTGGTLTIPTGQGIAIGGVTGKVAIAGNTITGTTGFQPTGNIPIPPSGQGIGVAHITGDMDLTLSDNQIRSNFNDGILILMARNATANLAVVNNTIENNGNPVAPDIRGDGIAVGVEQNAVVNNLTIAGNTIRGNGDEGVDIRVNQFTPGSAARVTGSMNNNTITNNGQNGIQLSTFSLSAIALTIDSNTINTSNNFAGILLQALPGSQLSTNVRLNILTKASPLPAFQAQSTPLSRICLNLSGNSSTTGYQLSRLPGATLQVVNAATVAANNTGPIIIAPLPITNVSACP